MLYVKESNIYTSIPDRYHQVFLHSVDTTTSRPMIVNLKLTETINSDDLKIIKFLYDVSFATIKQLEMFCKANDIEYLYSRIKYMFDAKIINKFYMVDEDGYKGPAPSDALMIYCLADGARYLLEHCCEDLDCLSWGSVLVVRTSRLISKYLLNTEFYLSMLSLRKAKLNDYQLNPYYRLTESILYAKSCFRLLDGDKVYYVVTEHIKSTENILSIREKLRNYESVFGTNIWKRYYCDASVPPMIIFFTDSDEMCDKINDELMTLKIKGYRFTTDERLLRGISDPKAFLKYDKDLGELKEIQIPLFA